MGKDRLKVGIGQVISGLPQADVPRDDRDTELDSAAVPPQIPIATLALRLGFVAGALGSVLTQGQPCLWILKTAASASATCHDEIFW